jgi:hypothetical protein
MSIDADLNRLALKDEARRTHRNRRARHDFILDMQLQTLDASKRFEAEVGFVNDATFIDILADATHTVAAHLCLEAVGIEQAHHHVGAPRVADEQELVCTDAAVTITHRSRERRPIPNGRRDGCARIYHYEIVAETVHFGEGESHRRLIKKIHHRNTEDTEF